MKRSSPRRDLPLEYELMPGDVALARHGERLKTLLGSCVAVILTDPRRTVGAMCHIVHASQPNSANLHNTAYGSCAMDDMFHRLRRVGLAPSMCQAYAFGGGNMFPQLMTTDNVGLRNARWVTDFLAAHNIELLDHSLGGTHYRKLAWTVGAQEPELIMTPIETEQ
jgi:chemotaxis protein CheD